MDSRVGIHVASKNSMEDYSIRELFDMFLTDKSIEGLSERTLHDYDVQFDYLMGFLGEEITNLLVYGFYLYIVELFINKLVL